MFFSKYILGLIYRTKVEIVNETTKYILLFFTFAVMYKQQ